MPQARDLLIYEDATVLAFDKPTGLASQGGGGLTVNLQALVEEAFGRPGKKPPRLIHRLDRETSGVIIFARTQPAAAFYSAAFAERRVEKAYWALASGGAPEPSEGLIDVPLVKTKAGGVDLVRVARQGEAGAIGAQSRYATLAAGRQAALLALAPLTGRMHQLRVHCAAVGRPIFGDAKYGGLVRLGAWTAPRLMLHAARLVVPHPDGGCLTLLAPAPHAFHDACAALSLDPGGGLD